MSAVAAFLVGIAMTVAVVLTALRYLKAPLQEILTDLCGTEDRSRFWTAFCNVTLFLVPFVIALDRQPAAVNWQSSIFEISGQIECAMIGFVASVLLLGLVLSRYIPRPVPAQREKRNDGN
jgi:hypothetical protein